MSQCHSLISNIYINTRARVTGIIAGISLRSADFINKRTTNFSSLDNFLKKKTSKIMPIPIKIGIIGGSGLDDPDILRNRKEKKVSTIFGEPSDSLILGDIDGVSCVLLARHGRKHDVLPHRINYRANIWALKEEGCTHIIASAACGSLVEHVKPGDIAILDNFIDRTQGRDQTFYDGASNHPKGICHMPMEPAFCERTRQVVIATAERLKIPVHKTGTVVVIQGPRYSSKAESMMYKQWGGELIGMTSVPEVVLAREAGICYSIIALATDYDCWREHGNKVCVEEVLTTFKKNVVKVSGLITSVIAAIGKENWDDTIKELRETVKSNVML